MTGVASTPAERLRSEAAPTMTHGPEGEDLECMEFTITLVAMTSEAEGRAGL